MRESTRGQRARFVRVSLPLAIVAGSTALAVRCGGGRAAAPPADPVEVRQAPLTTEISARWWKLKPCPTCSFNQGPSVAALPTPSHGTEIFSVFPGSPPGIEVYRTYSNIERKLAGNLANWTTIP